MEDITSNYCELPTGVFSLEFLPVHEISGWNDGVPIPANKWYGIQVYRDSLTYGQPTNQSSHGGSSEVTVSCLVVNDSDEVAQQLDEMERMRHVLRIGHYGNKKRIIGQANEYCDLKQTDYSPNLPLGAQGYMLTFSGVFSKRPIVI